MGKPKSSYTLWILGHLLRFLFALLIIGVCAMLLWRVIFSQNPPDGFDEISSNATLRAALDTNSTLTVIEQDQVKYTEGEDNYGYFNLDYCYFFKEADQVQLVLFYNNSVLEHLAEDRALSAVPPRGEEVFSLKLTQYIDVTPADYVKASENDILTEEIVLTPTSCEISTTSLYTFIRYTFDGVDLANTDTVVVYLDMFYGEEQAHRGTLRLFHRESETVERELTSKEKGIISK
jgi:hypothetical protein